ncbi:hypothetical protein [Salinimicrobium sp. HB62]|uniref:hypothetical protein n=1 Tax=Salinimicrobium sp. HB62 TaxID=3077781 RepID=UPI002D796D0A|nr:hypothetical protein [Salinimicrobium sp. HB62]
MKEKKYIDRLYQEKFRDFEAAPRDAVWKSIESKLQEKQRKKPAVPFWYRYAGVAALFAFLFMLGDWLLPVSPSATVANEDTEETSSRPSILPVDSPIVFTPLEEEIDNAETKPGILSRKENLSVAFNSKTEEKLRTSEEEASEIVSKNAIFETSVPVTGNNNLSKKNSTDVPEELKPSIYDALQTSEEIEIASTERKSNFEVSTHATPIYYGKIGRSNPLDVGFDEDRKAEVTYSYGVSVAMNISDKIKIRSGVNRVDLSYSTSGIGYQSVTGVYPVRNASLVKVKDPDVKMVTGNVNGRTRSSTNRTPTGVFINGNLNQKMGYIEVPLEFEINLWERKFELNLIGGGSTLFLDENEVVLNTGSVMAEGKADNLNDVSFSANLGLGVDYNLSEKFKLNLEPMLKYQLRTFDAPTGDVQPYFFGVYTGFSYRF